MPRNRNIFDSIGNELNTFFKPHGTLANAFNDSGHFLDERLIKPISGILTSIGTGVENLTSAPKQLIQSAPQILNSGGQAVSHIIDSSGNAINVSAQGVGGLASSLTIPLLIAGASLIGFQLLNR